MPVTFYSGNYLEDLALRLAGDIKKSNHSPFDRPVVIVQSNGMMKWLSLQIAKHNGICANIGFCFPKDFIYECFNNISDILPQESLYEKETLTWKIIDILPRFIELKEFSSLKSYL
ncbi:MAG: exodeoxyribonuclease V subunit gamma, partial [Bacteroidota bacterium]|nr:exodeoxyribonuclease V subunit gamma [Bacteroidota bacterium]